MTTLAQYFAATRIRGINEGIGQSGVVQSFTATPADGSLELPVGAVGPQGLTGPDAPAFRWEGDISDPVALAALSTDLGPAQAGKSWRVETTNALAYWNGSSFDTFPDAFGAAGPTGDVNTLSIGTVTTGAAGSDLIVSVTGAPPAQTLDLTIPRGVQGVQGPEGGPGPIRGAADYAESAPPVDRAVPMWDITADKWEPVPDPGWRGPWTIAEAAAWDGGTGWAATTSNINTTPWTAVTITIPAQDVAWRPMVLGGAMVRSANTSTRVDLEALLGSTSGQVVAVGSGIQEAAWMYNQLVPQFQTSTLDPTSTVGVVDAGSPATIYLVLRRNVGSGTWNYMRSWAHVAVWAVPVTGAP